MAHAYSKYSYAVRPRVPAATNKRLLNGVVVPAPPVEAAQHDLDERYGGIWYQTTNSAPFLYLPPVEASPVEDIAPHMSVDVLTSVRTPGGALIVLTGWFNYNVYQWQYYAVDPRDFDAYTPHYWRFMPLIMPPGWATSQIDTQATANLSNRRHNNATPS